MSHRRNADLLTASDTIRHAIIQVSKYAPYGTHYRIESPLDDKVQVAVSHLYQALDDLADAQDAEYLLILTESEYTRLLESSLDNLALYAGIRDAERVREKGMVKLYFGNETRYNLAFGAYVPDAPGNVEWES